MELTFAEKTLSAKCGREVRAVEIVVVEPDVVLSHDNSAAMTTARPISAARMRRVPFMNFDDMGGGPPVMCTVALH